MVRSTKLQQKQLEIIRTTTFYFLLTTGKNQIVTENVLLNRCIREVHAYILRLLSSTFRVLYIYRIHASSKYKNISRGQTQVMVTVKPDVPLLTTCLAGFLLLRNHSY